LWYDLHHFRLLWISLAGWHLERRADHRHRTERMRLVWANVLFG
jgi:hypothetical protein